MTLSEQEEYLREFQALQQELLLKKGNDYANQDRLSNFKESSKLISITPEKNCLSLIATKITRLSNLLDRPYPYSFENETINDSIIDLANYTFLLSCLLHDHHIKQTQPTDE